MIRFEQAACFLGDAAFPKKKIAEIMSETSLPEAAARVLLSRGVETAAQARAFLACSFKDLHDPMGLKDMDKAAERIRKAVEHGERVMVYGDYDCDGITATAMLVMHMRRLGIDTDHYIPHRHEEGYGLNIKALESVAKKGAKLLITVDCGITSLAEAKYAKELGMDLIITDHHQCLSQLPGCTALVNPKQPGDGYPFKDLSGVGVAAKLIQAVSGNEAIEEYLDLIAVGTVADIVPLLDENRVFATLGIEALRKGGRPGLDALIAVSCIEKAKLDAWHISFALAPRINAGGRVGEAGRALKLLLTEDASEAEKLAQHLDGDNKARQECESRIMQEALEMIAECGIAGERAIVLCRKGWNSGVVGIVASRLTEIFYRPVILLCEEDGVCTGSGRSIPGISMFDTLKAFAHLFTRFGGHEIAGGLTLPSSNLKYFSENYKKLICERYDESFFIPRSFYDLDLPVEEITEALIAGTERLSPFGEGNTRPVYRLTGVIPSNVKIFGKQNDHLKMALLQGGNSCEGVGYRMAGRAAEMRTLGGYDMLVSPVIEEWNGKKVMCLIKSARPGMKAGTAENIAEKCKADILDAFLAQILYNNQYPHLCDPAKEKLTVHETQKREEAIGRLMGEGHCGMLAVAMTAEGIGDILGLLEKEKQLDMADYCIGRLNVSPCPYHMLWMAPGNIPQGRLPYSDIILFDGCFGTGFIGALHEAAPEARIRLFTDRPSIEKKAAFARELCPVREWLLQCYRAMQDTFGSFAVCRSYAEMLERLTAGCAELDENNLRIALKIFSELELVKTEENAGLIIRMQPAKEKKELSRSETFCALQNAPEQILNTMEWLDTASGKEVVP